MRKMTFLDLFAGVGGFRLGMERAGFKCAGYVEWDKFARRNYEINFDTRGEWTGYDIRKISDQEIREYDKNNKTAVICAGFPCQAFSVAGKRLGFADPRGTLLLEVCRFIRILRPRAFIIENVKGLLYHGRDHTFLAVLNMLGELGYDIEWQMLNTKDFGVPQDRQRVIFVGYIRGTCPGKIFPLSGENAAALEQLVGGRQGERVYSTNGVSCTLSGNGGGFASNTGLYFVNNQGGKLKFREHANCLDANYYKGLDCHQQRTAVLALPVCSPDYTNKKQNGRRIKNADEPMFTLTGQDRHGVLIKEATKQGHAVAHEGDGINIGALNSKTRRGRVGHKISQTLTTSPDMATLKNGRIRKLTPLECFRLHGFPDSHCLNAMTAGISDSQLYKQAGLTVSVPVIYEVARRLANNINNMK